MISVDCVGNYEQSIGGSEFSHFEHKVMCHEVPIRSRSSISINVLLNPWMRSVTSDVY